MAPTIGICSRHSQAVTICRRSFVSTHRRFQQHLAANVPFRREKVGEFFQEEPQLTNTYESDSLLKAFLKRWIPPEHFGVVDADLSRFGHRAASDIHQLGLECERNPPTLRHHDAWGNRVDQICTSEAWKKMHDISAEEGLVEIAYKRSIGQWSRLYQAAKLYLYSPSSGLYSCPLAMTDGAVKVMQKLNLTDAQPFATAYKRLTSRDPAQFWTSGQWMTERRGGSDVANGTETLAIPAGGGTYRLHGYKWFTSATDADVTLTLARIANSSEDAVQGSGGLSLFYLETKDDAGYMNNIQVQRLKNKLGTRQLPTAELLLDGVTAYKMSDEGRGVASISDMLTITRYHNAICAVAGMRRILMLSRDYAGRRVAFGRPISQHSLHMQTLARMEVEVRGAFMMVMEMARLIGREDTGVITDHERNVLRILTPLTKLYTGKQAVSVISEGLESFGGQGYIEDTGLPVLLRDAQVLSIWEGTTNILSLDVLRGIGKSKGATLSALKVDIEQRAHSRNPQLTDSCVRVKSALDDVIKFVVEKPEQLETAARDVALSLSRIYAGALLLEHADCTSATSSDVTAALRWCNKSLVVLDKDYAEPLCKEDYSMVMDGQ